MPTYEYACTQCGQHIEVFQRMADASLTTCGACGGALRKVFHPAGIMFKGPGFYSTDNRSKSKTSKESSADAGATSDKAEAKSEAKSESKSEAKSESKSEATPSKSSSETKVNPSKEKSA
jgi:putative FmdB family regulatory protein